MSLGWQSESAILPSKSKSIQVDSKSMVGLKALVYGGEQQQRLKDDNNIQKRRTVGGGTSLKKKSIDLFEKSNKGVEKRNSHDDRKIELAKNDKIYAALKAKSDLYDQLACGSIPKANDAFLINFREKSSSLPGGGTTVSGSKYCLDRKDDEDDYSEIEDAFGRTVRVHRSSSEYMSLRLSQDVGQSSRRREEFENERKGQGQWAWSTGQGRTVNNEDEEKEGGYSRLDGIEAKTRMLLGERIEAQVIALTIVSFFFLFILLSLSLSLSRCLSILVYE